MEEVVILVAGRSCTGNSVRVKHILAFFVQSYVIYFSFFQKHCLCRVSQKTLIQAVCALCTHPFLSHNLHAFQSNIAFKSCGLTQRGLFLPHTSSEKRENQKDAKRLLNIQCRKTHSVTAAILCEITVGSHGPSCLCILLASLR